MWLLLVAAALPLVLGRGTRLVWAARLWVMACASWGLALAASRGDLGSFTPSESVVLAPAALAVAACVGLGISAFENDLTGREFGWRQVVSVAALVFVALGLLPVVGGAAGGRWDLPSQGVEQPLAFLSHPSTTGVTRVLWLGDPRALPAGGWTVQQGLAFALTPEGLPDSAQVFTPAGPGPAGLVADAVRLAVSGGTVHLGRLLAPAGVRYVVVLDGVAPSMVGTVSPSVSAPPPAGLDTDLLEQDDLQVVPGELGVQVFENGEDMPVTAERAAALPPVQTWSYPGAADVAGWQPVLSALSSGGAGHRARHGRHPLRRVRTCRELHAQRRRPHGAAAPGVRLGGAVRHRSRAGRPSRSRSSPTYPWRSLLELAAWVVLAAALIGRPRRSAATSTAGDARRRPTRGSREPRPSPARAPVAGAGRSSCWWWSGWASPSRPGARPR